MAIFDEGENPYSFGTNVENPSGENPVYFGYDPRIEYGEHPSVTVANPPQIQPTPFWVTQLAGRKTLPGTEEYADLLSTNPDEYYKRYALALSTKIASNINRGTEGYNQFLSPEFESLKEKNPEAYLQGKINLLSRQAGWQYGQNTGANAKSYEDEIKKLVTEADKFGLNPNDLNSIINSGFSDSSLLNQERIRNDSTSAFFNFNEVLRGVAPVAALAIGGPLLDAALAGGAAAGAAGGAAAGTGLTGGAGGATGIWGGGSVGTGLSAGSAAGIAGTQAAAGLGIAGGSALAGGLGATGAGLSGVGGLSPALPAAGGVGGAGAMSAQLAPGTILGTGLPGGGAIGSSYMLGANGLPAVNSAGQLISGSSVSFGGQAAPVATNLGIKDVLDAARLGKGLLSQNPATPAGATQQFRGSTVPQGAVDYSGILNLLQTRAQQRNPYSLLG